MIRSQTRLEPFYYIEYVNDLIYDVKEGMLNLNDECEVKKLEDALIGALKILGCEVEEAGVE